LGLGGCARAGRRQAWEVVALLLEGMMRRMDMMDAKIDSVAETFQVGRTSACPLSGNATCAALP
jgi:hypothetical protein